MESEAVNHLPFLLFELNTGTSEGANKLPFVVLNVFTRDSNAGNPLAIVKVHDTSILTHSQKLEIAQEFDFSETVFLYERGSASDHHHIEIFMTTAEIPFAGHPTVGAAYFILKLEQDPPKEKGATSAILTKAGLIPSRFDDAADLVSVDVPHDVHNHKLQLLPKVMADCGISSSILHQISGAVSFFSIVKGMTFALIELPSTAVLSEASESIDPGRLGGQLDKPWYEDGNLLGTYYFVVKEGTPGTGDVTLSTRMFAGTLEDPATGSAASALSVFLAKSFLTSDGSAVRQDQLKATFHIEQGADMGSRSEITVAVELSGETGDVVGVTLSGSAVPTMRGKVII